MSIFKKDYVQIPLIYLIFGFLWIVFTDSLVHTLVESQEHLRTFQTLKGWLFVFLSACVIFTLVCIHHQIAARERAKREKVFHQTVSGSCHIILNYLNQMKLLTLEAENCSDFDPKLIEETEAISTRALNLLQELDRLEIIESEEIEALIYRELGPDAPDLKPNHPN